MEVEGPAEAERRERQVSRKGLVEADRHFRVRAHARANTLYCNIHTQLARQASSSDRAVGEDDSRELETGQS